MVDRGDGPTPTPVISQSILAHNRGGGRGQADGIVITPSHNPPEYGGFKYDPPSGGPADPETTGWIEKTANALLGDGLSSVPRIPWARARRAATVHSFDYVDGYVGALDRVVDMDALRGTRLRIGVDPLGGASAGYWQVIGERYGFRLQVVNPEVDPTFRFMTVDWDGEIRMDPSSPYAMARLIGLREQFDLAFAADPDADRHGIVTRSAGLMNPNHYLAVALRYLFTHRPDWPREAAVGKTIVSSSVIDRVAARLERRLVEVPVGFKYFVAGFLDGSLGFAGEESAGASFLRRDGTAWATDKDGLIMGLLAAEMTARTGRDPGEHYREITAEVGEPAYERIDAEATPEEKAALARLTRRSAGDVEPRRRPRHRRPHHGPRRRAADRRHQGAHRAGLVRRAPLGHRGRLQALRGELPGPRPPAADPGGGASRHQAGAREGRMLKKHPAEPSAHKKVDRIRLPMIGRAFAGLDALVRRFIADQGFLLASALSFSFLLCLAPLALLLVAGMGFLLQSGDIAAYVLEMASSLVPGYSEEISAALGVLIRERTVSGVVGGFGLAIFTVQLFSLTRTVMNVTFRTERRRGIIHGFAFDLFALGVAGLLAAILCGALLVAFAVGGLGHAHGPVGRAAAGAGRAADRAPARLHHADGAPVLHLPDVPLRRDRQPRRGHRRHRRRRDVGAGAAGLRRLPLDATACTGSSMARSACWWRPSCGSTTRR